jgi:hypothetical protein
MNKHVVITSFTEEGYVKYGKEFIRTFIEYWPKSVKLVVYYEGTHLRHDWIPITQVPNLDSWMRVIAPFQIMSGSLFNQYDIRYDARTNRVIFMQNHALRTYKGKVFWLDGDVITHSPVPEDFLDGCLPDDKLCCYLGRGDWYDTETGFIGFNYGHPNCEHFLRIEENTLFSGIIFTQKNWWDMACFDWSRDAYIANTPKIKEAFVDLAQDLPRGTMHVFANSIIGSVCDHLKGTRKKIGHSYAKDLVIERLEPYWQKIIAEEKNGRSKAQAA